MNQGAPVLTLWGRGRPGNRVRTLWDDSFPGKKRDEERVMDEQLGSDEPPGHHF